MYFKFSQVGVCQRQAASHCVQQGWGQQAGQAGSPAVDQGRTDATFLIFLNSLKQVDFS